MPEVDLLAEIEDRGNDIAGYQSDLADGHYGDEEERRQLEGGIAYESLKITLLMEELARRERALQFGYRASTLPAEPGLLKRFAALRAGGADELADLIGWKPLSLVANRVTAGTSSARFTAAAWSARRA